jgi:hypothetical protein
MNYFLLRRCIGGGMIDATIIFGSMCRNKTAPELAMDEWEFRLSLRDVYGNMMRI